MLTFPRNLETFSETFLRKSKTFRSVCRNVISCVIVSEMFNFLVILYNSHSSCSAVGMQTRKCADKKSSVTLYFLQSHGTVGLVFLCLICMWDSGGERVDAVPGV